MDTKKLYHTLWQNFTVKCPNKVHVNKGQNAFFEMALVLTSKWSWRPTCRVFCDPLSFGFKRHVSLFRTTMFYVLVWHTYSYIFVCCHSTKNVSDDTYRSICILLVLVFVLVLTKLCQLQTNVGWLGANFWLAVAIWTFCEIQCRMKRIVFQWCFGAKNHNSVVGLLTDDQWRCSKHVQQSKKAWPVEGGSDLSNDFESFGKLSPSPNTPGWNLIARKKKLEQVVQHLSVELKTLVFVFMAQVARNRFFILILIYWKRLAQGIETLHGSRLCSFWQARVINCRQDRGTTVFNLVAATWSKRAEDVNVIISLPTQYTLETN